MGIWWFTIHHSPTKEQFPYRKISFAMREMKPLSYIHTYGQRDVRTYIRAYLHTYIPAYLHTCIPTYVHTYIHGSWMDTYVHRIGGVSYQRRMGLFRSYQILFGVYWCLWFRDVNGSQSCVQTYWKHAETVILDQRFECVPKGHLFGWGTFHWLHWLVFTVTQKTTTQSALPHGPWFRIIPAFHQAKVS